MSYDGKIMHRALRRFEDDRRLRQEAFHSRQEEIYAREPRLREIQAQLGGTMARLISSALRRGTDPRAQVTRLRDQNLALQRERRELLADRFGLWRLPVSWGWVVLLCLPLALLEVLSDAAFLITMGICWAAALIWYGLLSRWVRKHQTAREEPNQADQPEAGRRLPPR